MTLSDGQLSALRNLSQKKAGAIVGWIDIADARDLTDLGLAVRTGGGWRITPAGEETLMREERVIDVENVVALKPRPTRAIEPAGSGVVHARCHRVRSGRHSDMTTP